nr:GNAT family N-acetyltransferase [Kaistia dalseonensis]
MLDLLPETVPSTDFRKEEGVPFLRDVRIPGDDPALRAALRAAELADDDLDEPGRAFFLYRTLAGEPVGFGGYEQFGVDVLLRSIVVLDAWRGTRIGRNLVPLLQRRAFDVGARRAWLLTPAAAGFFGKLGFKPAERESAPSAILTTRQAAGLCPSDTPLLTRRISF